MSNRSTIMGLYEVVHGPVQKDTTKRYSESTQTLYKDKTMSSAQNNISSDVKDIYLDPEVYAKVVRGEHPYLVTNKHNFRLGEELHLIECSPDRRTIYKTVTGIETHTDEPGLVTGYIILTLA